MVIKQYIKGKQLMQLEKIKDNIEKLLENKWDYSFKFEVNYNVSLEITPRKKNNNKSKIRDDFDKIKDYLIKNDIDFSITWWKELIVLAIKDN